MNSSSSWGAWDVERGGPLSTGGRFYLTVRNSSVTAWNIFTVTWSAWMGHKCFKCSLKEHLLGLLPEVTSSLDQAVRADDFCGALRWGDCVTLEVCYLLSVNAPEQSGTAIWHWASNFCHRWGQSKRLRVWEGWADVALASFLKEVAEREAATADGEWGSRAVSAAKCPCHPLSLQFGFMGY